MGYDATARALVDQVSLIMTRQPTVTAGPWDEKVEESIRRLAANVVGLLPADHQLAFVFEASPAYWRHVIRGIPGLTQWPPAYTGVLMFPHRALDVPQLRALQAIREAESQRAYEWSPVPEDPNALWIWAREWIEPLNNAFKRKLPGIADVFLDMCSAESAQTRAQFDWLEFLCDQLAIPETTVLSVRAYRPSDTTAQDAMCALITAQLDLIDPQLLHQQRGSREDRRFWEGPKGRGAVGFVQKAYYRVRDLVYNPRAQLQRIYESTASGKPRLRLPTTAQAARLAETTVNVMKWHSAKQTGDEVVRVGVAEARSRLAEELSRPRD